MRTSSTFVFLAKDQSTVTQQADTTVDDRPMTSRDSVSAPTMVKETKNRV